MRLTNWYEPVSVVCVSVETLVEVLETETVAPGTTAPAVSVMVPVSVARSTCASATRGAAIAIATAATAKNRFMIRFLQSKDVRESPTRYWSGGPPSVTSVQHFRNAKLIDVVLRVPEVLGCYGAVLTVRVLST